MRRWIGFCALSACLAGPPPLLAAEIAVSSRIDTVTVFPNGAEVARLAGVQVDAGSHVLTISDLPSTLEENSVRVDGEATAGLEISSIDARKRLVKKAGQSADIGDSERKRIEAEVQALTDERASFDGAIAAAEGQKTLAENLSRAPLAGSVKTGEAAAPPTDWSALFDLIGARIDTASKAIQEARIKQRGLDERIAVLKEQLRREPPEQLERTELRVYLDASAPVKGTLRIRYQVPQASWEPIYDARLTIAGPNKDAALTLARRASISQNSGEDWDGALLTLSTARPDGATAAPDLPAIKVIFKPEPRPATGMNDAIARRMDAPAAPAEEKAADRKAVPVKEIGTEIENAPYQTDFVLTQRVTVKTGVGQKKVLISADELKPSLLVLAVPKADAKAYLHAKFTHDSVAPLLPGAVSLYRDGVYVGQGWLPLTVRGEEQELGFGPDDSVKVARVELKRAKGESGLISSMATDEQHFKITVKNLHDWTVPVTVIDQMPVSEDQQITVDLLPMTTEPSEQNYDDKLGVLAWSFDLPAGQEKEIALSYETKWPAKRDVIVTEF